MKFFIIFEEKNSESILNLLEPDEFQSEIEKYTKLKVEYFDFELRKKIINAFYFFIPAIAAFIFSYLNYLDIRFSFLVLTVNSIFFLVQFSEKRTRGGFSESTVRRSTIILFLVLAFQLVILFGE